MWILKMIVFFTLVGVAKDAVLIGRQWLKSLLRELTPEQMAIRRAQRNVFRITRDTSKNKEEAKDDKNYKWDDPIETHFTD